MSGESRVGHGPAPLQPDPCPTLTRTPPPAGKTQVLVWGQRAREAAGGQCPRQGPPRPGAGSAQALCTPCSGRAFPSLPNGGHRRGRGPGPGVGRGLPGPKGRWAGTLVGSLPLPGAGCSRSSPGPGPGVHRALAVRSAGRARAAGWRSPHFLLAHRLRAALGTKGGLCPVLGRCPRRGPVGYVCVCSQAQLLWPA